MGSCMSGYRSRKAHLEDLPSIRASWFKHWRTDGGVYSLTRGDTLLGVFTVDGERLLFRPEGRVPLPVDLISIPMRFGGSRLYMCCPRCEARRTVLYLVQQRVLQCRGCLGLQYRSQSRGAIDGCHLQASRIAHRMNPRHEYNAGCPPCRPKGMHRKTYRRLRDMFMRQMERLDVAFAAGAVKVLRRTSK